MASLLTGWTTRHPRLTTGVMLSLTLLLAALAGLSSPRIDTDPENMLSEDEAVRVFHHQMKEALDLHDIVVVGVVNEHHTDGVFNPASLARIHELTEYAKGFIGDAVHVELHSLAQNLDMIPTDRNVIVYCGSGYRAALAAASLQALGYDNVKVFTGSWKAWTAAGEPVSTA